MRKIGHNKKALQATIFMHIQKTAGTSIVRRIRKSYGHKNIISHGDHLDKWREFPLIDKFFDPELRRINLVMFLLFLDILDTILQNNF